MLGTMEDATYGLTFRREGDGLRINAVEILARPVAVEHFGMVRNIDRYLEVYRKALADGPR